MRRRARNPSSLGTDVLLIGALAALGYWLWTKSKTAVSSLTAPVVNPIADLYADLTMDTTPANPQGLMNMPDGSQIAMSSIALTMPSGSNVAQFAYQGNEYYVSSGADSNGNYTASLSP